YMPARKILYALLTGVFAVAVYLFVKQFRTPEKLTGTGPGTIDENIVLRVSGVAFTGYEVEKNLAFFKGEFTQKNGRPPGKPDIENWLAGFIDKAYFLADAYKKDYT